MLRYSVLGMRISFQVRTLPTFSPSLEARIVLFDQKAKGFVSSLSTVGCDVGSSLSKRAPKFQPLTSGASGRESFSVNSLSTFGNVVPPDADENIRAEPSNASSFRDDISESDDDSNGFLSTLEDNSATHGGVKLEEDARNMAIKLLSVRSISVAELLKKLTARKYPLEVVNSVVAYLQKRGLINDGLYAESFCHSRWLTNSWGPLKIKKALIRKGISAEVADKAITLLFNGEAQSGSNQSGVPSMSQHSMEHLLTQASKQWLRYQNKPPEKRKSSMIRWLQYRGFDWTTIGAILKKLE